MRVSRRGPLPRLTTKSILQPGFSPRDLRSPLLRIRQSGNIASCWPGPPFSLGFRGSSVVDAVAVFTCSVSLRRLPSTLGIHLPRLCIVRLMAPQASISLTPSRGSQVGAAAFVLPLGRIELRRGQRTASSPHGPRCLHMQLTQDD
jgi:hypothetical protein